MKCYQVYLLAAFLAIATCQLDTVTQKVYFDIEIDD